MTNDGRPRTRSTFRDPMRTALATRVTLDLDGRLRRYCAAQDVTMQSVGEVALDEFLRQRES